MKVAFLAGSISRNAGGLSPAMRGLSTALCAQGVVLEAFAPADMFSAVDGPAWHPAMARSFPVLGPASFGFARGLLPSVTAVNPDLVHSHGLWMYPSVAAWSWQRRVRRPCLVAPHGMLESWALQNSRWKKRLAGWLFENRHLREAACIHALCRSEANSIRAYGLSNPICIVPNGVDLPRLGEEDFTEGNKGNEEGWEQKAESRKQKAEGERKTVEITGQEAESRHWKSERKMLLFLGRIHPKKGLVNLLRAWSKEQGAGSWVLVIAGWDQGGHEAELKTLATELGIPWADVRGPKAESGKQKAEIEERGAIRGEWIIRDGDLSGNSVVFAGPLFDEAKTAALRACDAFILPSFSEGLPMAVLEAWAYGKPVLMTPECNLPEGFAADGALRIDSTVEGIAASLHSLLPAPRTELAAMGARGRALVEARFTWPRIAAEMKSVYEWVLGGGPKPNCVV